MVTFSFLPSVFHGVDVPQFAKLRTCREAAGLFPVFASYKLSHCGTYVQVSVNISPPFPGMNAQESSCWLVP